MEANVDNEDPEQPESEMLKELKELFWYLQRTEMFMIICFCIGAFELEDEIMRASQINLYAWCAKAGMELILTWYMFMATVIIFTLLFCVQFEHMIRTLEEYKVYIFAIYSTFLFASSPWLYRASPLGVFWLGSIAIGMTVFIILKQKFDMKMRDYSEQM